MYLGLVNKGFKQQNINLNDYDKIQNILVDKGIDYRHGSRGRTDECFYILLKNYDKKLGVYRMVKDYQDLLNKFNIGDSLTVYFRDNDNKTENINIDLVQVEKGNQILLDKKEYEQKESSLIYLGLVASIFTIILLYRFYKKGRI